MEKAGQTIAEKMRAIKAQ
jgi:hypothetical protein